TVTAYNNGPVNILTDDCRAHWESVCKMASADIRNKYAGMLYYYRKRLREYISEDSSAAKAGSGISHSSFPSVKIPSEDRIGIPECPLDAGVDSGQRFDPKSKIDAFRGKLHDTKSLMTEWENTYKDLMGIVVDIDEQLSGYAGALGEKCGENIGEHKKAEKEWNSKIYAADRSELPDSSALAKEKKEILESLSCTEMTPSLNFQDQLNMEDSLREGNSNIRHYIGCIQAAKSGAFLLLVLLLTIMVVIHYSVLQPYNFTAFDSLLFMAAYIVCSAVLMLCSWTFPMRFYRKKIRKCLDELKEEMSRKIEGYFKRAKQFRDYTNAINRLDYIDRYLSFAQSEKSIEQTVRNAKNWHKEEANKHLKNLGYFDSLISTCHENDEVPHKIYRVPSADAGHIDDIYKCSLYWPQI
ncbi:MAG: hypothetical protein IKQ90_05405, partial [Ruminococcus sp.]|nr:hypothetical protein [Ruminococcus sp.]